MKNKVNLNTLTYGYMPWRHPRNWWRNIQNFFRNIQRAWERITKGFSYYDTFDLDDFYTKLFINSLIYFRENLHSAPYDFFDSEKENQIERWENYLDEIIEHFSNSLEENSEGLNPYNFDDKDDLNHDKWFEKEMELAKWRADELNKGLDMLKEHFQNLWD